jgi:hypothetical protein
MPKKIYYGDVVIQHRRTKEINVVPRQVYTEGQNVNEQMLRKYALRHLPRKERDTYNIIRCCYDTAKQIGTTAYD